MYQPPTTEGFAFQYLGWKSHEVNLACLLPFLGLKTPKVLMIHLLLKV